ncbi:hypothetical protein [Bacillus paralicheniformis]|uniref:hypothetical protein n=1 Tax=Bacillus paralicheniformis TaxID=1648923 RepID=UPI002E06E76A|nr:hypothetical protein [Bacillus paralicheniformis]MED1232547.1 hypothetical protein [Bacillus paralicheniformis]
MNLIFSLFSKLFRHLNISVSAWKQLDGERSGRFEKSDDNVPAFLDDSFVCPCFYDDLLCRFRRGSTGHIQLGERTRSVLETADAHL